MLYTAEVEQLAGGPVDQRQPHEDVLLPANHSQMSPPDELDVCDWIDGSPKLEQLQMEGCGWLQLGTGSVMLSKAHVGAQ